MWYVLIFAVFVLPVVPIVLYHQLSSVKEHRNATGDVVNYNGTMQSFVFQVFLPEQEIRNCLACYDRPEELQLVNDHLIIRDATTKASHRYRIRIFQCKDHCIVRVKSTGWFVNSTCYLLNPLFVSLLDAKIVPYSVYGDL